MGAAATVTGWNAPGGMDTGLDDALAAGGGGAGFEDGGGGEVTANDS